MVSTLESTQWTELEQDGPPFTVARTSGLHVLAAPGPDLRAAGATLGPRVEISSPNGGIAAHQLLQTPAVQRELPATQLGSSEVGTVTHFHTPNFSDSLVFKVVKFVWALRQLRS